MLNNKDEQSEYNLPGKTIDSILFAGNWMSEVYTEHLKKYDLSIQQFKVLETLKNLKGEPANLSTIQGQMVSKMSNTTRLVEKLRTKGLLTREQCEKNRRKIEIRITSEGLELLKEIETYLPDFKENTVKNLSSEELILLNKLLVKISS